MSDARNCWTYEIPSCEVMFLLKELGMGIRVDSGDLLCSLAYADDLVLLADSAEDLQTMVDKVSEWCRRWRLHNSDQHQENHSYGIWAKQRRGKSGNPQRRHNA